MNKWFTTIQLIYAFSQTKKGRLKKLRYFLLGFIMLPYLGRELTDSVKNNMQLETHEIGGDIYPLF